MASSTPRQEKSLSNCFIELDSRSWQIGDRLTTKTRELFDQNALELHEVYTVTRIDIPSKSPNILKIKKQIVSLSKRDNSRPSEEILREISNLERLTEDGCTSTPKLLAYSTGTQGDNDTLPGGYIAYIVMEKVPGENLRNFDSFTKEEQDRVRIAFIKALWEFTSLRFVHRDPRLDNIIWNCETGECFIVDLEDAEKYDNLSEDDIILDPWEQLGYWGLFEGERERTVFKEKDKLIDYLQTELPRQ